MPSQRETQKKTLTLKTVAGINERELDVELPPEQYSAQQGLFPEFAGLQSRLWGKRTLTKFANSVYSIYQFWSPYGYGAGLYQFNTTLDYGIWLTPTTEIETALLSNPALSVDGGGFTVDNFGYGYGSNFGYSDPNVCGLVFAAGGTQQISCILEPAPVSTPDDRNGGPAGQGRHCKWVSSGVGIGLDVYAVSAVYGDTGAQDVVIGHGPIIQVPLPAIPIPVYTSQPGPFWDAYMFAHMERGSYYVGSDSSYHNNWHAYGGKVVFDFTPLELDPSFVNVTMVLQTWIRSSVPAVGAFVTINVPSGELNFADHLPFANSIVAAGGGDGFGQVIECYPVSMSANYRKIVCT